jgi:hypothetical protein
MDLAEKSQRLWQTHGRALCAVAHSFSERRGHDRDDMEQEVAVALLDVVHRYPEADEPVLLRLILRAAQRRLIDFLRAKVRRARIASYSAIGLDSVVECPELQAVDVADSVAALHGRLRSLDRSALELLLHTDPLHHVTRGTRMSDVAVGLGLTRDRARAVFRRIQCAATSLAIV